jgi:hypothetical protein
VLAVGGVHARENLVGNDFFLEASNYASSFDSLIYPGRHVPDFCGLVGMKPLAAYIMLPVPPGSSIDLRPQRWLGGHKRHQRRFAPDCRGLRVAKAGRLQYRQC